MLKSANFEGNMVDSRFIDPHDENRMEYSRIYLHTIDPA
jgi:hypothetical protein